MLTKPFLAKCQDRTHLPKSHPTSGSPEDWFAEEFLEIHNLTGITFDFFVNWSTAPHSLTPVIWIKRILQPQYTYRQAIDKLESILFAEFGAHHLHTLKAFGANHNLKLQILIFRDDAEWGNSESQLLIVDIENNSGGIRFNHSLQSIEPFKAAIRQHSGGDIRVGAKGLTFGTSRLECHLSSTQSLYPGDVDMLILDTQNRPFCILEFKKHTLDTSISVQQLSNYYPRPDARKYNRLAILKDYLHQFMPQIPLCVLYYPTRERFKEGKLELLHGPVGKLSTRTTSQFPLPSGKSHDEYHTVIHNLKKAVALHHSLP